MLMVGPALLSPEARSSSAHDWHQGTAPRRSNSSHARRNGLPRLRDTPLTAQPCPLCEQQPCMFKRPVAEVGVQG